MVRRTSKAANPPRESLCHILSPDNRQVPCPDPHQPNLYPVRKGMDQARFFRAISRFCFAAASSGLMAMALSYEAIASLYRRVPRVPVRGGPTHRHTLAGGGQLGLDELVEHRRTDHVTEVALEHVVGDAPSRSASTPCNRVLAGYLVDLL